MQRAPLAQKGDFALGDIKLFHIANGQVNALLGATETIEKSVQTLFERNLEAFLGVRFLASEFTTTHGGRIDTLGLDENGCPVILEYKRATNENVINQGLFYLDWLMDHRKDFQWLVLERLGKEAAEAVDWSAPRLICIAGDFNRYDDHAVKQIQRNIELIRYRRFGPDLLMLDLVSATAVNVGASEAKPAPSIEGGATVTRYKTVSKVLSELDAGMVDRFEALRAFMTALGDDVQETTLLYYIAFKRIKNFACVEFRPTTSKILIFVKIDPTEVTLEPGFTRDVSNVGHFGTGDLEITLSRPEDIDRAKPLIQRSYEAS
jgi:predicted transport protein